ncbi:unnamed protein product [Gulo gulo]|uniref:Uncharacterized protein n=1 Tax=Gulo gulo TaxID=48420 RepID=A0A9X9LKG3_GULGU|nr:unnamed protein product [Gulo gulo]
MASLRWSFLSSNSPLTLELSRWGNPLLLTPGHRPNLSRHSFKPSHRYAQQPLLSPNLLSSL